VRVMLWSQSGSMRPTSVSSYDFSSIRSILWMDIAFPYWPQRSKILPVGRAGLTRHLAGHAVSGSPNGSPNTSLEWNPALRECRIPV
jgi:hypothetical protein